MSPTLNSPRPARRAASYKFRVFLAFSLAAFITACGPMGRLIMHRGTEQLKPVVAPPPPQSPHVLIFALDGVGYDQFTDATKPGASPAVDAILGNSLGSGIYTHGYSIPNAVSVLPSTTIDAWTATFTGAPPAYNGITGNEWFQRETATFYAPAPVSLPKLGGQTIQVYSEDLIGKQIKVPTLFEKVKGPSFVSLNGVYRGASIFTSVDVSGFGALASSYLESNINEDNLDDERNAYAKMDLESIPLINNSIEKNGVPSLQVVYFPGIDLFTHIAENGLHDQVEYFRTVINPAVEKIIEEYRKQGALDSTWIIFISDHGHTPVLKDEKHALGAHESGRAAHVLTRMGFRLRPLEVEPTENDYTATLAYQGAIAYVYLANRAICPAGSKCDWSKPPRFKEDVMPIARAFYRANLTGDKAHGLKGAIDLVFARKPLPTGTDTLPYEVFDGHKLIPIGDYLKAHPRPDFIQLERRMKWLSAGPWGNHAGDVLLLSKSGLNRPIEDRYYFSRPYNSWHGSPSMQDSHITFAIANAKSSGAELKDIITQIGDDEPSQLDLTPLVLKLLKQSQPSPPVAQSLGNGPVSDAR